VLKEGESQTITLEPHELAAHRTREQALVEREVARLSGDSQRLASRIIARLVEIEAEWGAEVAEAVVERLIDVVRGRKRVLS